MRVFATSRTIFCYSCNFWTIVNSSSWRISFCCYYFCAPTFHYLNIFKYGIFLENHLDLRQYLVDKYYYIYLVTCASRLKTKPLRQPDLLPLFSLTSIPCFLMAFLLKLYSWTTNLPSSKPHRTTDLTCCHSFLQPTSPAASWLSYSCSTRGQQTFPPPNHTAPPTRLAPSIFSNQTPLLPHGSPTPALQLEH